MATKVQIFANRGNAEKSTGPRTFEGKARSSKNRMTHGMYSDQVVMPHESEEEYLDFCREMALDLGAETVFEHELAIEIANCRWKMRRTNDYEGIAHFDVYRGVRVWHQAQDFMDLHDGKRLFDNNLNKVERVYKVAAQLTRQMERYLKMLREMQAERRRKAAEALKMQVSAPVKVDEKKTERTQSAKTPADPDFWDHVSDDFTKEPEGPGDSLKDFLAEYRAAMEKSGQR